MKVCCLDLELNQPSGKIIQIGYVIVDLNTKKVFRERSLIVNPNEPLGEIEREVNGKKMTIEELTGITEARIKFDGRSLVDTYEILCIDIVQTNCSVTCVQWGDGMGDHKGDHDAIRRELGIEWKDFVFRARSWDVKSLYQIYAAFNNRGVVAGLGKAMKSCGLEFEGKEHDALDDAKNTFTIFNHLAQKMNLYDKIKKLTSSH